MSIFDKELTFEEALSIDTLLDSGGISPEMFLMTDAGQQLFPNRETTTAVLKHLENNPQNSIIEPKTNTIETDNNMEQTEEQQKKNPKREYIKLPDASIRKRRVHKPKQSKAKRHNVNK